MASKRRCRMTICSRSVRRTMSIGSTSTARSGRFSTSSLMRASNFTFPTMPTLRPKLRKVRAGHSRERTGEGHYIECALVDTYFNMHEVNVPKSSLRGSSFAPKRAGSLHPDGGPTGVFRYRGEEFIAIMVMPYQWSQMIKAMNMPELADDPRFNTPRGRRDNNAALKPIIEGWLGGFTSRDAAVAALEAERVPCAPVLTLHEAMAHPHLRQRGTVRRVSDETIGAFDIPGLPVKFSRWAERSDVAADCLGEHNEELLRKLLSLTESEIAGAYADKGL